MIEQAILFILKKLSELLFEVIALIFRIVLAPFFVLFLAAKEFFGFLPRLASAFLYTIFVYDLYFYHSIIPESMTLLGLGTLWVIGVFFILARDWYHDSCPHCGYSFSGSGWRIVAIISKAIFAPIVLPVLVSLLKPVKYEKSDGLVLGSPARDGFINHKCPQCEKYSLESTHFSVDTGAYIMIVVFLSYFIYLSTFTPT